MKRLFSTSAALKKAFVVAGEPSGDAIGGPFLKSLKKLCPNVELFGVGGARMQEEGLKSIFPIEDLGVMGITDVLLSAPTLLQRFRETKQFVSEYKPDVVVTIDSKGFNFRLLKHIRETMKPNPTLIHYVAPSIWAYKNPDMSFQSLADQILCLFPFEPKFFPPSISTKYVGHPLLHLALPHPPLLLERERREIRFALDAEEGMVAFLPGSRIQELVRSLPKFKEIAREILPTNPNLRIILPVLPQHFLRAADELKGWGVPVRPLVINDDVERNKLFQACDAAVAVSGTITLELAAARLPSVVIYPSSRLNEYIVKKKANIPFAALPNILLHFSSSRHFDHSKKVAMEEFLFSNCRAEDIAKSLNDLLHSKHVRNDRHEALLKAIHQLSPPKNAAGNVCDPSDCAAETVVETFLKQKQQKSV